MEAATRVVLFDLDGTISDSALGIINGIKYAISSLGIAVADDHDWRPYLGPPFRDALSELQGLDTEQIDLAVDAYLEYYRSGGMYENVVYDGMPALLEVLDDRGLVLAVATSKRSFMANGILEHFGLLSHFSAVGGAYDDGTGGKKVDVIERTLAAVGVGADRADVVMVGDRLHDIEGAKAAGLSTIGVRWGYAEPGELEAAGADAIADDVEALERMLSS